MSTAATNVPAVKQQGGSIINVELKAQAQKVEGYLKAYRSELSEAKQQGDELTVALLQSQAIGDMREMLKPMMPMVMRLMGTPLGFLTDKDRDNDKYGADVVATVVCEALVRGFKLTGNHFNIIAARFYGTKGGFEHALGQLEELTDLVVIPGVPTMMGERGALVPVHLSWKWKGTKQELVLENIPGQTDRRIAVRVNAGMTVDAVVGKALSKAYRRLFNQLTMTHVSSTDDDPEDVPPVAGVVDSEVVAGTTEVVSNSPSPGGQANPPSAEVTDNREDGGMELEEYIGIYLGELQSATTEAAAQLVRDKFCGPEAEFELPPDFAQKFQDAYSKRCQDIREARTQRTQLPKKKGEAGAKQAELLK